MEDTQKAAVIPDSLCKTPEDISTPPEDAKPCLQTPVASERASPIVQEPEEASEPKEESSPRKTSLVIVESTDDQPQVFEKLDGDAAFQKVRPSFLGEPFLTYDKVTASWFLFLLFLFCYILYWFLSSKL